MPFKTEIPVTTQDLVTYLKDNFGDEVAVPQLMNAADEFKCSLATVKKRLKTCLLYTSPSPRDPH